MDTLILALRVVLSLGAVIAVLWLVQRRVSRGAGVRGTADPLKVVARKGLGQKASVVVIETGGQRFLLGVTEHSVNVLQELAVPAEEVAAAAFANSLQQAQMADPNLTTKDLTIADLNGSARPFPSRRESRTPPATGALGGSILAGATWRQAAAAVRKGLTG
ncbi:flagellar biosynthetic protein FliO [Arthrobacter sp. H14-L1]|uniref:flagellar biosynthetic protein FliO n=1 Tax=Arthrobacter sp. H14-L1 TaxID=2996697 RepID=UPI002272225F|nr:flagellar biosynthetic protein FliO [Arthrobacter sp. H14-L1]MCY0903394.1 flagellar biosynthetic protein FliO [Arthrobacter sp. H14-L1]